MADEAGSAVGYTQGQALRKELENKVQSLKTLRQPFESHFQDLADHMLPRRLRLNEREKEGAKINQKIIDPTGTYALRTCASGMMAGITSPARPWFRLTTANKQLREDNEVKAYLGETEMVLRERFQHSNLYNAMHTGYADSALFGTSVAVVNQHPKFFMNTTQLLMGEYWIGCDDIGLIDTVAIRQPLTVHQVVAKYVFNGNPYAKPQWDRVSKRIKNLWDKDQYNRDTLTVWQCIYPRMERDGRLYRADNKPIASVHWLDGGGDEKTAGVLRNSGFDENPIIADRWDVMGSDFYGRSPGMDVLPDLRMLMVEQRYKGEAIQRNVRPTMIAPTALEGMMPSMLPGVTIYSDTPDGVKPAYEVNTRISELSEDIKDVQERVREGLYANLFNMISSLDRREITAREIDERHEEKLIGLGPVLERVHFERLNRLIDRAYAMADRAGILPPVPRKLRGEEIKVEYISMLAQAQKAVATGGIERLWAFAGNLAAIDQTILDKLDGDQTLDEYAEMLGVPTTIIVPDGKVAERRQQRSQQVQASQAAAMAKETMPAVKQGAEAAATLAEADKDGNVRDLLTRIGLSP